MTPIKKVTIRGGIISPAISPPVFSLLKNSGASPNEIKINIKEPLILKTVLNVSVTNRSFKYCFFKSFLIKPIIVPKIVTTEQNIIKKLTQFEKLFRTKFFRWLIIIDDSPPIVIGVKNAKSPIKE